ncbi:G-type lectin S-receptor-like serine/threonine-protein kinase LECRK1 [Camellia lanceoleosa]|nr:G-type lectin S-receptor-like serine/threonine-protein kinase LECRK1 [Camellia lanceoleosa]
MAIATTLIFFLVIHSASLHLHKNTVQAQQQRHSNITLGSSLTPTTNSSWLSASGLYAFGFYPEGNGYAIGVFLAGISEMTVVWTANRDNAPVPSNATLVLTIDGRLVLQQPQSQDSDITNVTQPASYASMLDSGNFVLYNYVHNIIWQSFDHPTDTILPSQILLVGQELISRASETDYSTGIFSLSMQQDGNLVQYPVSAPAPTSQYAYWASGTDGYGGVLMYRNHVWAYEKISAKRNVELGEEAALRTFTFAELEQVTNGFNQELGRGAFGSF